MIEQIQEITRERSLRDELEVLIGKNIFIKAGAGAGKSTLMINRLTHQARAGNQPFNQTVAITFTNKAATDLEKKVMENVSNDGALLTKLPDLTIGTIHAFCQKILDERPIEAGLSPGFSVMEDTGERENLLKSILAEVMDDELPAIQVSVNQLQQLGESPFTYYALLESKVDYMELGMEEHISTSKTAEQFEEMYASMVDDFLQEFNQLKRYFWAAVKPGKIKFKVDTKNLSLHETIEQCYEETASLEALLAAIFTKGEITKCLKNEDVKAAYESGVQAEITAAIVSYIKTIFVTKFKKVDFAQENWVGKFCEDIAKIEENTAWFKQLEKLTATEELREENLDAIFEHFFNTTVDRYDDESLFVKAGLTDYQNFLNLGINEEGKFDLFTEPLGISKQTTKTHMYEQYASLFQTYTDQVATEVPFYELTLYHLHCIFNEVIKRYKQEKLQGNIVSHNDLLRKTFELLQDEAARAYFHQKYKYIYIDEFQDTDPLQTKILFYLTSKTHPTSIEDAQPVPGSLFVVGDPKQSIYRFRNADLRIYDQIYEIATKNKTDWTVADLQINFRSNEQMIHWFNATFTDKFAEETDHEKQHDYEAMFYYDKELVEASEAERAALLKARKAKSDEKKVNVYKMQTDGTGETFQKNEAEKIANWIEREYKKNKDDKTKEVTEYSDVMIITRGNYDVIHYVNALKAKGIPTSFSGKIDVNDFPEIVKLIDLVDYLANPNGNTVKKLYAQNWHIPFTLQHEINEAYNKEKEKLRGTDDSIETIVEVNKQTHEQVRKNPSFEAYYQAKDVLDYYRDLASSLHPLNLLHQLVYECQFGILPNKLTETEYESSLSILTTYLEGLPNEGIVTLADLALVLKESLSRPIEYEMSVQPKQNAVQILNLHKTKGLQAEVVFLASPKADPKLQLTSFVKRDKETEVVEHALFTRNYFGTVSSKYQTKSFLNNIDEIKAHEEAERIRLIYVAATRARQLLIIGERNAMQASTWDDLLSESLPELTIEAAETKKEYRYITVPSIKKIEKQATEEEVEETGSYVRKSPSRDKVNMEADEALAEMIQYADASTNHLTHAFKGPLWGNIIHTAYEFMIDKQVDSLEEADIREIIGCGLEQYEITNDEIKIFNEELALLAINRDERLHELMEKDSVQEAIKQTVSPFFSNKKYQHWIETYEAHTEISVTAWLDEATSKNYYDENKAVQMNGIIDLVLVNKQDEDKVIIIDYKTDEKPEDRSVEEHHTILRDYYWSQLSTYQTLLTEIYKKEVEDVFLYAVATDTFISMKNES